MFTVDLMEMAARTPLLGVGQGIKASLIVFLLLLHVCVRLRALVGVSVFMCVRTRTLLRQDRSIFFFSDIVKC